MISKNLFFYHNFHLFFPIPDMKTFEKNFTSKLIHLNFNEEEGSKLRLYGINVKPFKENIFQSIKLLVQNQIKLKNYKTIERKQNCYYLKKND